MSLRQRYYQSSLANRRQSTRRPICGFVARCRTASGIHQYPIRDISATGVFLITEEQWQPGSTVVLTLCHFGVSAANLQDPCVSMPARVVRDNDDGIALAFHLPSGIDLGSWLNLVDVASGDSPANDIVSVFRMARAFAFLTRASAPPATSVLQQLRARLTGQRVLNAIDIALQAESLVAARDGAQCTPVDPTLILHVLEEGSWTEERVMAQGWAALLATALTSGFGMTTARELVELFAQLTLTHYRILSAVCARSSKCLTETGEIAARPYTATADQIMHFSDTRDLLRMGRAIEHLAELGLIEEHFNTSMFAPVDAINITPTSLGLWLYARCIGHAGPMDDLYQLTPAFAVAAAG